jgi:hypothetical protein
MPTWIYYEKDHRLKVDEDLAAVQSALLSAHGNPGGMAHLTANEGQVLVNPARINYVKAEKPGSAKMRAL